MIHNEQSLIIKQNILLKIVITYATNRSHKLQVSHKSLNLIVTLCVIAYEVKKKAHPFNCYKALLNEKQH